MLVTVCARLDDVRSDLDAVHGQWVVSLDPADAGVTSLGYARAVVAGSGAPARLGGVAVVLGTDFAPDPLRISVIDPDGPEIAASDAVRPVERASLPAVFHVDQVGRVVRLLRSASPAAPRRRSARRPRHEE